MVGSDEPNRGAVRAELNLSKTLVLLGFGIDHVESTKFLEMNPSFPLDATGCVFFFFLFVFSGLPKVVDCLLDFAETKPNWAPSSCRTRAHSDPFSESELSESLRKSPYPKLYLGASLLKGNLFWAYTWGKAFGGILWRAILLFPFFRGRRRSSALRLFGLSFCGFCRFSWVFGLWLFRSSQFVSVRCLVGCCCLSFVSAAFSNPFWLWLPASSASPVHLWHIFMFMYVSSNIMEGRGEHPDPPLVFTIFAETSTRFFGACPPTPTPPPHSSVQIFCWD